ncbi:AP2/ERF domain-containing protein [Artemisia annua]|uniref:AP2/ERF domain-containing protein n=1 Tax=Artemisia annua TaxID=35608 RepID=A0A2U1NXH4_ARTAN|nr:AP2/ERF domain-containing protein [Artemisia annua]
MQRMIRRPKEETTTPMRRLTSEEEATIMVNVLKNVISGNDSSSTSLSMLLPTQLSVPVTATTVFPVAVTGTDNCAVCKINGCLGCKLFSDDMNLNYNGGVDYTTSTLPENSQPVVVAPTNSRRSTNTKVNTKVVKETKPIVENDFLETIGEGDIQEWMMMMMDFKFNDDSSDSTFSGNVHSV